MPNRKLSVFFSIFILFVAIVAIRAEDLPVTDVPVETVKLQDGLKVCPMTLEEKRATRRQLINEFIACYTDDQTFDKISRYMRAKYEEKNIKKTPKYPGELLTETFEKSNNLIAQTKKFYGDSFTRVYDPEVVEKKVRRFLWLKGLYFFILGINDEHRLAMSYFYLPGNEAVKQDFFERVVMFSYPEIPDVPENKCWRQQMTAVMEHLGYDVFSIKKFIITRPEPDAIP